jgi:hypothetical protein
MPTIKRQITKPYGTDTVAFSVHHRLHGKVQLVPVGAASSQRTARQVVYLGQGQDFTLFGHLIFLM